MWCPQEAIQMGIQNLWDTKRLVHFFDIFAGKIDHVPGEPDIGVSGNIVLKLAQVIHGAVKHLLYFDNWFSSLDVCCSCEQGDTSPWVCAAK